MSFNDCKELAGREFPGTRYALSFVNVILSAANAIPLSGRAIRTPKDPGEFDFAHTDAGNSHENTPRKRLSTAFQESTLPPEFLRRRSGQAL